MKAAPVTVAPSRLQAPARILNRSALEHSTAETAEPPAGNQAMQQALRNGLGFGDHFGGSAPPDTGAGLQGPPIGRPPAPPYLEADREKEAADLELGGNERSLAPSTRQYFEPRLGADLSDVRLHTGAGASATARRMGAQGFASGSDVVLGGGAGEPRETADRWLLAHELTHVVQQSQADQTPGASREAVEAEADRAADALAAGRSFRPRHRAADTGPWTSPVATGPGGVEFSGDTIILTNFDIEGFAVKPEWLLAIQFAALRLNLDPSKEAVISGHTDSTGTPGINNPLSLNRADAIQQELAALVLEPEVASPISFGFADQFPIDTNATAAGRARNRRVEIDIVDRPLPLVDHVELVNGPAAQTFDTPAAAPVPGSDHGVTVGREAAVDARLRAVLDTPLAPGDRRAELLTWTTARQDPANRLEADMTRAAGQNVGVARLASLTPPVRSSQAQYTVWSLDATIASGVPVTRVNAGPGPSRQLTMDDLIFRVQVTPAALFSTADAPNLRGAAAPPTPVPGAGTPHPILGGDLGNGVNPAFRFDVTRRLRTRWLFPAHLTAAALGFNAPPIVGVAVAYPANRLIGNDDRQSGDEDNDPYADGQMQSHDQPSFNVLDATGNHGDIFQGRLQFQEFIRLDLGGAWRQISDDHPWKVHYRLAKVQFAGINRWFDAGSFGALDNAGF